MVRPYPKYKGQCLNCHVKLDLLVERTIIIEVKTVERGKDCRKVIPLHRAQLLTYLRLQQLWLGLCPSCLRGKLLNGAPISTGASEGQRLKG